MYTQFRRRNESVCKMLTMIIKINAFNKTSSSNLTHLFSNEHRIFYGRINTQLTVITETVGEKKMNSDTKINQCFKSISAISQFAFIYSWWRVHLHVQRKQKKQKISKCKKSFQFHSKDWIYFFCCLLLAHYQVLWNQWFYRYIYIYIYTQK